MTGPMSGVKVVEMGVWVAGPADACVLADWGAEVLKIEPIAVGDPARLFSRMLGADLPFNPPFEMDNRGKRSIAIDLGDPEGLAIALELVDGESTLMFPATPADFGGESPAPRSPAPSHGEHTDAVLTELGRSTGGIARLRANGVVL